MAEAIGTAGSGAKVVMQRTSRHCRQGFTLSVVRREPVVGALGVRVPAVSVRKGGLGPGADSDPDGRVVLGVAGAEAAVCRISSIVTRPSPLVRGTSTARAGRLGDGDALGRGQVAELAHGLDVLLDVAGLPAGVDIAHVGYVAFAGGCGGAGDEAAAER